MTDQPDTPTPPDPALAALRGRLLQAELRVAAREAGMVDLDGLKMLDQSSLALDEKDELPGAAELMQRLKRDKPYLFPARAASSSTAATPPAAAAPKSRNAMEMSLEEWRAARAELLRRR